MWISDIGIVAMFGVLAAWASTFGFWHMAALYLAPLAFTNCWLVLYTWLQVPPRPILSSIHVLHARTFLNPTDVPRMVRPLLLLAHIRRPPLAYSWLTSAALRQRRSSCPAAP